MKHTYPPAPWHLQGHGVQLIHTVPVGNVRKLVPPELSIVSVLPGRTLGVVAFAHYGTGSVLEYDELIVAPAVVRHGGKWGVWVSHIYVNNPASLEGGRQIWGVPKELAEFDWEDDGSTGRVSARMHGQKLCSVAVDRRWWMMRKRLSFPTYSQLGSNLIRFVGDTHGRIGWGRGKLDIPPESPFGKLGFAKPKMSLWVQDMTLICGKPTSVGLTSLAAAHNRMVPQLSNACSRSESASNLENITSGSTC